MTIKQKLNVAELDFDTIKANLRNYLSGRPELSDYDFNGSTLNILLDVLAYNTHYNAVLANLQANEMFIDTAIKRGSILSIAKMLGYRPRSTTSARARITVDVVKNGVSNTLSITPSVKFTSVNNGVTYIFNVNETQTQTVQEGGYFTFTDVDLIEGTFTTTSYVISNDSLQGPLIIPNNNIDTTTIEVEVQNSVSDLTGTTWTKVENVIDVTDTSKVFWVEENSDGLHQIVFGDNTVGASLVAGNIVYVTYAVSSGPDANGCRNFTLVGDIGGEDEVTITTVLPATGGAERESIDSVRFNAPRYNSNRNRAVTAQDYRTLIKQNFPKAREVTVWGGEENSPPVYGSVFISLDPIADAVITEADKNYIKETILRPRSVMSIKHEFVDPDYLYLGLEGVVNFNPRVTTFKASDLAAIVKAEVEDYFNSELGTLDRTFFLSRVSERVKEVENSIMSSVFKIRLQKRIPVGLSDTSGYTALINFLAAIEPESVRSANFVTTVSGNQYFGYLQDFSDDAVQNETGTGTIKFISRDTGLPVVDVGTVNYNDGIVRLRNVIVTEYSGNVEHLYLHVHPQPLYQNISSSVVRTSDMESYAVAAKAAKNTIITLDDSQNNSDANITPGLIITCRPYTQA